MSEVNNIRIEWNENYGKYQCITPDGRVLEEFRAVDDAMKWASETFDFIDTPVGVD